MAQFFINEIVIKYINIKSMDVALEENTLVLYLPMMINDSTLCSGDIEVIIERAVGITNPSFTITPEAKLKLYRELYKDLYDRFNFLSDYLEDNDDYEIPWKKV